MELLTQKIAHADWARITEEMHENGYSIFPNLLTEEQCEELKAGYSDQNRYRKTVVMARYRFGLGEYKYFQYPLLDLIQTIRAAMYSKLAPIANAWFAALKIGTHYPSEHADFLQECHLAGQQKATVLILKYGKGGFNTLHQDLYGEVYFPIQIVMFLDEPERDYSGGEFVLTQQIPRAQSKAIVLRPKKGDVLIFTTNFKPEKGSRGYYRVAMKHGVSEVKSGSRHTLGIIFHDATS